MKSITSKVIGELKQNDRYNDCWESELVEIPFYDKKKLKIEFLGLVPENDTSFINEADQALEAFLKKGSTDRLELSGLAYQNCMDFLDEVGYDEEYKPLWDIEDKNEIWNFIYPCRINLSRSYERDKDIYIVVICGCEWEVEHGLQLVFRRGKKLTRISDIDGHLTDNIPNEEDELLSQFETNGDWKPIAFKATSLEDLQKEYANAIAKANERIDKAVKTRNQAIIIQVSKEYEQYVLKLKEAHERTVNTLLENINKVNEDATGHIEIQGTNIYISTGQLEEDQTLKHVFEFHKPQPTIRVYEEEKLKGKYLIETLEGNPDLTGQFYHADIQILKNGGVMISGVISKNKDKCPNWQDSNFEAVKLQPFFLSNKEEENQKLKGAGLFQRGVHFKGIVTSTGVRAVCICDDCKKSFTLQHIHAGMAEVQYFYSSDSKQTLMVPYGQIADMPMQLQGSIDEASLELVEQQLPKPTKGQGNYRYYNPFRCPHCGAVFIDFEKNKNQRPMEYYGNYLINQKPQRFQ